MDILNKRFADFQQYIGHDIDSEDDDDDAVLFESLPLVGMVVLQFNMLENSIDSAICAAINDRTDAVGLLVIDGMGFVQKVELYRRLCENLHATVPGPVASFAGLAARLKDVATLRNHVVHANWITSDTQGYTYTRMQIKRGGMQQEYVQLTPEAMRKVGDEIKGASDQLHAYLEERDELLRDKPRAPSLPATQS